MTVKDQQEQEPIRLELSRVDTIHVTTGAQKVASLCLVLKDSPAVLDLLDNSLPVSKMVITDVVPLADDPTKAEVFFRNLTTEELIETNRRYLIPSGSLEDIFGNLLGDHLHADGAELSEEDMADLIEDAREDLESGVSDGSPLSEFLQNLGGNENAPEASSNTSVYTVVVTLAEAHLAQVLCVGTNAPAFVLTSENLVRTPEESHGQNVWEDFIAILEFPYTDTPEYFDSTATLTQAITGSFPMNISIEEINEIRAMVINQVMRMAEGSSSALVEGFGAINPFNKTNALQEKGKKPLHEDAINFFHQNTINKLYAITAPAVVASLIQETPPTQQHMEDIQVLDSLFQENGLDAAFEGILHEEYSSKTLKLSDNPSHEEIVGFYSTPITADTLPESMAALIPKIQMPLLYENNWAGGNVAIEITPTNVGEISVARLITIAVRFARLEAINNASGSKFVPAALLLQGLGFPGEGTIWAFVEAIKLLNKGDESRKLFDALAGAGLPTDEDDGEMVPEEILQTPAANIMHKLGHSILEEEWERVILLGSLKDKDIIADFVNMLYDTVEEARNEESGEVEHEHGKPCPVMLSVFKFLAQRLPVDTVVEELGDLIRLVAELNALKHTDFTPASPEWNDFIENYLSNMFGDHS